VTNTVLVRVLAQICSSSDCRPFAGHLVERAERLVHQQQRRRHRERPRDRDALLHATGQLGRIVPGELGQPDQGQHLLRRDWRSARDMPRSSSGSSTLRCTVRHSNSPDCWNAMPYSCFSLALAAGSPATVTVPRVGLSRSPMSRSSVLLPQPGRPDQRDELAVADGRGPRRTAR
jgi:hypothetical protein